MVHSDQRYLQALGIPIDILQVEFETYPLSFTSCGFGRVLISTYIAYVHSDITAKLFLVSCKDQLILWSDKFPYYSSLHIEVKACRLRGSLNGQCLPNCEYDFSCGVTFPESDVIVLGTIDPLGRVSDFQVAQTSPLPPLFQTAEYKREHPEQPSRCSVFYRHVCITSNEIISSVSWYIEDRNANVTLTGCICHFVFLKNCIWTFGAFDYND